MIDTVHGTVTRRDSRLVSVQIPAGLTFSVQVPDEAELEPGAEVILYTHLVLSGAMNGDGEFRLYGFATKADRRMFLLLKSVSGVGGNAALSILSKGLDSVIDAIAHNEPDALRVKGVGPKITKRIVDDLGKKVDKAFAGHVG
jgi:Holliday junction DNA helicase RuvA